MRQSIAVPVEEIARTILILRGRRVVLDTQLAGLYGVTTKRLNEQVKRNIDRFPGDFMFRLTQTETITLNRSQFVTGSHKHRDPRFPPFVFTEHGAIMAATILNSPRAVEMSLYVVRAFVQLRELLGSNKELVRRFAQLEARLNKKLAAHDKSIAEILLAIRRLMNPSAPKRRGIGFTADLREQP
jgi:ORF6N domain